MRAILTEISAPGGVGHSFPIRVEGCRGKYGRFDCLPEGSVESFQLLDRFEHDMRCKYNRPYFGVDLSIPRLTIKKVIFNDPATIVIWNDNTKTVVKCQHGDKYDKKLGLALCLSKKLLGNKGNYNEVFKKWIEEPDEEEISVELMRDRLVEYCEKHSCYMGDDEICKLESCRCGTDAHFKKKYNDKYTMSDDEIRHAYKIAFED